MAIREDTVPQINIRGSDWISLRAWLSAELDKQARIVLQKDLSEKETDFIRGKADMIRSVLALESRIEKRILKADEE